MQFKQRLMQRYLKKIAPILEIQQRYVGEEPYSEVTAVYNQAMQQVFGQTITLTIVRD